MIDAAEDRGVSSRCCTVEPEAAAQPHRAPRERHPHGRNQLPLVVRPSYVLGGRALNRETDLRRYMTGR
jgi:hypothetical protein